jgi:glutamate-ammonia-ligase adenylyltransferase
VGLGAASANAYRVLRHLQHLARLDEAPAHVPTHQVEAQKMAIEALWRFVFS